MSENESKEIPIQLDKIINIDEIKDNSIICLKISEMSSSTIQVIQQMLKKYGEILDSKNCSLLVLSKDTDLTTISEEQMEKSGWVKKNKSNLILPN